MRHGRLVAHRDACWVSCAFVTFYRPSSLSLPLLVSFFTSTVDHALHSDAGSHPQCGRSLRGGCLLWAQCGRIASATMVRTVSP